MPVANHQYTWAVEREDGSSTSGLFDADQVVTVNRDGELSLQMPPVPVPLSVGDVVTYRYTITGKEG